LPQRSRGASRAHRVVVVRSERHHQATVSSDLGEVLIAASEEPTNERASWQNRQSV
jgi:hypothetical protein